MVEPGQDSLYSFDPEKQKAINEAEPWKEDHHYFKNVQISAVALIKMVMHAHAGGSIEVMGLMQGRTQDDTFIVTDAFRLPVEGTETRVNAQEDANAYMVEYLRRSREAGQSENVVGWYHSHPGYGCWLSGIDVGTQVSQQAYFDPSLAVVIDPDRTISAGKVEIGAFRTFPDSYKPPQETQTDDFQTIPLGKIEDFGAHSSRYYSLSVSHFKSSLDTALLESLWNKYWVATLSSSPLFTSREYGSNQIVDLSYKAKLAKSSIKAQMQSNFLGGSEPFKDDLLKKLVTATDRLAGEETTGLASTEVKDLIFNRIAAK